MVKAGMLPTNNGIEDDDDEDDTLEDSEDTMEADETSKSNATATVNKAITDLSSLPFSPSTNMSIVGNSTKNNATPEAAPNNATYVVQNDTVTIISSFSHEKTQHRRSVKFGDDIDDDSDAEKETKKYYIDFRNKTSIKKFF
jgi:hypothetical protein